MAAEPQCCYLLSNQTKRVELESNQHLIALSFKRKLLYLT